ncbi:hypothetical protein QZH41_011685 [Actinostola sp. cb2023]|nr:hypothetical protein QZH41_011685 [Actinostola sp. cb2023]
MISQAILIKLFLLIKYWLAKVYVWWKMPFVLVMLYQFRQRDLLMKNNLFDVYPRPIEPKKQYCNDPVVGYYHLGCYCSREWVKPHYQRLTFDNCIRYRSDRPQHSTAQHSRSRSRSRSTAPLVSEMKSDTIFFVYISVYISPTTSFFFVVYCTERMRRARTIDGTCNDLENPAMGSRLYRFSRNVPLNWTAEDNQMLEPNPRKLSLEQRRFDCLFHRLLVREKFIPVKQINLLAAGWIQFMVHDWFDHGTQDSQNRIHVPLERNDPLYTHHNPSMRISRTKPNGCSTDKTEPATYQNDVTHWWDLSQLYGSDPDTNRKVRSFEAHNHGKLKMDGQLLPLDVKTGIDVTGFSNNWWVGLALMHNIFTREHNAICDMLHQNNPYLDDDKLFDTARLINTAVMVKIHTIEWTPAILNNTALRTGVRVNWGLDPGQETWDWLAQFNITTNPGIKPLVGQPKNLRGVPFSLSEEFVSVYRMHPLLPDYLKILSMESKTYTGTSYSLPNYSFANTRKIFTSHSLADILYTFGVDSPGALTLNNYPKFLTNLKLPFHQQNGESVDVATIDILRDRERGVPRYNNFRRLINLKPVDSFEDLTPNVQHVAALKRLYCNDIEKLDLLIGSLAEEPKPTGFGFGETQFNLFLFMASRRLETDRFLSNNFTEEVYSKEGMKWIKQRNMTSILLDAFKQVQQLPQILKNVDNPFFPWV